jgi:hypothetical protein
VVRPFGTAQNRVRRLTPPVVGPVAARNAAFPTGGRWPGGQTPLLLIFFASTARPLMVAGEDAHWRGTSAAGWPSPALCWKAAGSAINYAKTSCAFFSATSGFSLPPPAKSPESTQTWTFSQFLQPPRFQPLRRRVIDRKAAPPARNPCEAVAYPVCLSCSSEESLLYAHKVLDCCLALL